MKMQVAHSNAMGFLHFYQVIWAVIPIFYSEIVLHSEPSKVILGVD